MRILTLGGNVATLLGVAIPGITLTPNWTAGVEFDAILVFGEVNRALRARIVAARPSIFIEVLTQYEFETCTIPHPLTEGISPTVYVRVVANDLGQALSLHRHRF
ncbi:MAG: hypothetical protein COU33_00525 [Candidatus Magasanikbacteria bacterium CG10_big_fil_rev_8_21_14_0_10_43_6]|uniref:Uncharacterized protein n=1 Tax=Candidatus Magasanikbacteria bacterium CG10_big_fil_rev_8_21_14_0_10_43_6 TaxID=1974650 RepID=A0A2M6W2F6_9BACT|nr:MAG: hypothetical protein COU33_00525 [Candidatus Magasanikbacteria bacterium CG10_big_fil_rev_8_21_14_0_10_43_6]